MKVFVEDEVRSDCCGVLLLIVVYYETITRVSVHVIVIVDCFIVDCGLL